MGLKLYQEKLIFVSRNQRYENFLLPPTPSSVFHSSNFILNSIEHLMSPKADILLSSPPLLSYSNSFTHLNQTLSVDVWKEQKLPSAFFP